MFFFIQVGGLHGDAQSLSAGWCACAALMKGTSVSRSLAIVKCSSAKSPSTSSYEYQSREKSLAPTGIRHSVKPAPTPGANSSRSTDSRSAAESIASDVQPSSLKHAPKPSIAWSGPSVCTSTSAPPPGSAISSRFCQGDAAVVTYQSTPGPGGAAFAERGAKPGATSSAAAPFRTARRLVKGSDLGSMHESTAASRETIPRLMSRFKT